MNRLQLVIVIFISLKFLLSFLESAPLPTSMDTLFANRQPLSQVAIRRVKRGGKIEAIKTGAQFGWKWIKKAYGGIQAAGGYVEKANELSYSAVQTIENVNNVANVFKNRGKKVEDYGALPMNQEELPNQFPKEKKKGQNELKEKKTEEPLYKQFFMEILCGVLLLNVLIFLWFVRSGKNSAERNNIPPLKQLDDEEQTSKTKRKRKKTKKRRKSRRK